MTTKNILPWMLIVAVIGIFSCSKEPNIDHNIMLDGDQIFDPSLYNPELYLVSLAIENPTPEQLKTPVVIAVHGYSATTFEWSEFRNFADTTGNTLVSQVLLGGHGRTYEEFKNSSWKNWQEPIMEELNALKAKGYTSIHFAGSSTACPLALNLIKEGHIGNKDFKTLSLIDPIVIPSDKLLSIVGLVGPMLGYIETDLNDGEEGHWYHFRPQETLQELMDLIDITRKDLQNGFTLPSGSTLKVYKSTKDGSADPASAVLIFKGLKQASGSDIEVEMIDSELHVHTHLSERDNVTQHDKNIQAYVFEDMHNRISK